MARTERTHRRIENEAGTLVVETESIRKLYSLAELKRLDEEGSEEVDSRAYQNAVEFVQQGASEFWDGIDEVDNYIAPEHFGLAGITFNPRSATWALDHGRRFFFALPRDTDIDVPVFLRALQAYFDGRDYRGKDYAQAERKVIAPERERHHIDLRSKDARAARELGLVVHTFTSSMYGDSSREFDWERDYENSFSAQFREDCNAFLNDLCEEAAEILYSDLEYALSEEAALESAEANEMEFDREGRTA